MYQTTMQRWHTYLQRGELSGKHVFLYYVSNTGVLWCWTYSKAIEKEEVVTLKDPDRAKLKTCFDKIQDWHSQLLL